jgi:hypothetical protein
MYTKVNLNKPNGISPGSAAPKSETIIVDVEDIQVFPNSDQNGVKLAGQFVLKAGASMYKMYGTKSKTDAPYESDGDEDSISINQKFMIQHPGNKLEIKEFIQNWLGRNVIILHKACQDGFYEVMGTPCAPLQVKPAKVDNNDGRYHTLNFESFAKTALVPKHYEGAAVFAEPFTVADATAIPVTNDKSHYKIPASSTGVVIGFVNDASLEHGKLITLIGDGGTDPATLSSGTAGSSSVLLMGNSDWVALRDSVINFEVFNQGGTTFLIEKSRG